jgi:hypothetical protein
MGKGTKKQNLIIFIASKIDGFSLFVPFFHQKNNLKIDSKIL